MLKDLLRLTRTLSWKLCEKEEHRTEEAESKYTRNMLDCQGHTMNRYRRGMKMLLMVSCTHA